MSNTSVAGPFTVKTWPNIVTHHTLSFRTWDGTQWNERPDIVKAFRCPDRVKSTCIVTYTDGTTEHIPIGTLSSIVTQIEI
jgi:hypothetical protein